MSEFIHQELNQDTLTSSLNRLNQGIVNLERNIDSANVHSKLIILLANYLHNEFGMDEVTGRAILDCYMASGELVSDEECRTSLANSLEMARVFICISLGSLYADLGATSTQLEYAKWLPVALSIAIPETSRHSTECCDGLFITESVCRFGTCPIRVCRKIADVVVYGPVMNDYIYEVNRDRAYENTYTFLWSLRNDNVISHKEWIQYTSDYECRYVQAFRLQN